MPDGNEIELKHYFPTDDELTYITTTGDMVKYFNDQSMQPTDGSELGTGWQLLKDKRKLLGRPFMILFWERRIDETTKRAYTTVHLMENSGERWIINDGSTGIHAQLEKAVEKRHLAGISPVNGPMRVNNGLRVSDYTVENAQGGEEAASTFYLNP